VNGPSNVCAVAGERKGVAKMRRYVAHCCGYTPSPLLTKQEGDTTKNTDREREGKKGAGLRSGVRPPLRGVRPCEQARCYAGISLLQEFGGKILLAKMLRCEEKAGKSKCAVQ